MLQNHFRFGSPLIASTLQSSPEHLSLCLSISSSSVFTQTQNVPRCRAYMCESDQSSSDSLCLISVSLLPLYFFFLSCREKRRASSPRLCGDRYILCGRVSHRLHGGHCGGVPHEEHRKEA